MISVDSFRGVVESAAFMRLYIHPPPIHKCDSTLTHLTPALQIHTNFSLSGPCLGIVFSLEFVYELLA